MDFVHQDATPQSEWPYKQDWIVERVILNPDGYYRVTTIGRNLSEGGKLFVWRVPLPLCWRYDLTNAVYELTEGK